MLRLVDLSLDIYDKAPTFYPDPKTAIIEHLKIENLNYNITQIVMSAHLGTHLDAPFHFFDDGLTVENLDVRKGFGPAWVFDFTHKKAGAPITLEDFQPYADKVTKGSRLILNTGWDKEFPQKHYFGGQPYLTVELTTWMAKRGIWCLALDMPTTYPAEYTPSHHSLLNKEAEVLIVEGLRGLDRLQSERVIFMAFPLRIRGRDGSPCRAMALDGDVEPLIELFEQLEYSAQY
jgi:arylformamidase